MNEIYDALMLHPKNAGPLATRVERTMIALPELPITVRLATMEDIPFIDSLQKKHNKSLGFMFKGTLEGKIRREEVLIAEEVGGLRSSVGGDGEEFGGRSSPTAGIGELRERGPRCESAGADARPSSVGYLIGNDRYAKRDELGCIFQLCVVPGRRRGLIGATLLKALFERASYGCRLYCCWCAQDLEANHFWEAMGFVPLAFRTGSKNKNKRADKKKVERIHIFWQKRIRSGDTTTPWWYPHETGGGSIGEDRLVLPIGPNIHWSEVDAVVLPGMEPNDAKGEITDQTGQEKIDGEGSAIVPVKVDISARAPKAKRPKPAAPPQPPASRSVSRLVMPQFASKMKAAKAAPEPSEREKPAPKVKQKNDPAKVKAARFIRDRYLEEVNRGNYLVHNGKYDVSRLLTNSPVQTKQIACETVEPGGQKQLAA